MQFNRQLLSYSNPSAEPFIHYVKTLSLSVSVALSNAAQSGHWKNQNDVPEVVTSTGRKVPNRNPKAKSWVSPYGGKRK